MRRIIESDKNRVVKKDCKDCKSALKFEIQLRVHELRDSIVIMHRQRAPKGQGVAPMGATRAVH